MPRDDLPWRQFQGPMAHYGCHIKSSPQPFMQWKDFSGTWFVYHEESPTPLEIFDEFNLIFKELY